MDRYFIGQRVRVLCHAVQPALGGRPARIVGRITQVRRCNQPIGIDTHWLVALEGADGSPPTRTSRVFVIACTQLQPLPPEGMVPARWEDCAWRPETVPELVMTARRAVAQQRVLRALAKRFGR
jgi:hypothetical protein